MEQDATELLAIVSGALVLAAGLGRLTGPYQRELAEAVFQWFAIPSHRKPIFNFAIGMFVTTVLLAAAAVYLRRWEPLVFGVIVGFFSAFEAAREHDAESAYHAGQEDMRDLVVRRRSSIRPRMEE